MLSFIIPAYNEELELPPTLEAIHHAARSAAGPYEIIVVDDASQDATTRLAKSAGAEVVSANYRQIAAARNAGAQAARGDILFFVDADTQIAPSHVSGALRALSAGAAGGGARVETDDVPRWSRIFIYFFCKIYFACNLGAGAFLFTTRENFAAAGGFDEQFYAGEEVYFTQALKKMGRFELLRQPVRTSGRKLRLYSARHILWRSFSIARRGQSAVRSREGLDFWYDGKRETGPA